MASGSTVKAQISEEELIVFLKEVFNLNLKKDDLMEPEIFCNILFQFLKEFGLENVCQVDLNAAQGTSDLDRFEETLPLLNIWACMDSILKRLGISDFTMGDIFVKRRARKLKIIWSLCRLYSDFASTLRKCYEMEAHCADLPARRQQIESSINELKRSSETKSCMLSKLKSENAPHLEQLEKRVKNRELLQKQIKDLEAAAREQKVLIGNKKEEISSVAITMGELKQSLEELQSKVVHSPEKILSETAEKEQQLESVRQGILTLNEEYVGIMQTMESVASAQIELSSSLCHLTDSVDLAETLKGEINNVEQLRAKLKLHEQEMQDLVAKMADMKTSEEKIALKKSAIIRQHNVRLKPMKEMNDQLEKELQNSNGASKNNGALLEQERALIKKLETLERNHVMVKEAIEEMRQETLKSVALFNTHVKEMKKRLAPLKPRN